MTQRIDRIVSFACLMLFACNVEQPIERDEVSVMSFEEYALSVTKTFEGKKIYVVDGDIAVSAVELRQWYDRYVHARRGTEAPYGSTGRRATVNVVGGQDDLWSTSQAGNLTYCITNNFGSDKQRMINEMAQATADLEAVGNFNFVYDSSQDGNCTGSNPNVVFAVRPWSSGGACAFFPSGGGCVARTVVIDIDDLDNNPAYGNVTTLGVLRHELGHALGLRHEHIRAFPPDCTEGGAFRSVTAYDSDSMMHYPWCGGATNNGDLIVTPLDAEGLGLLYPGGAPPPPPPPPPPNNCPPDAIDFSSFALQSYSNQDANPGGADPSANGDSLTLTGNTWKRSAISYDVTSDTVVEFEFSSTNEGEIHAIGFDANQTLNDDPAHFQFYGFQNWTGTAKIDYTPKYSGNGSFQSFSIPVGQTITGNNMRLVFTNDNDAGSSNNGTFRCVRVFEDSAPPPPPPPPPPPGGCSYEQDFEGTVDSWTTGGNCSTGTFVLGTPTQVTNSGVITQVAGDHTTGDGVAAFTATNSSAGVNDVDSGECTLTSPTISVSDASTLAAWYFHGQRDGGDDPGDDYFVLEVSTNGGSSFSSVVSIGDVQTSAAWTEATTAIPAGSDVVLRIRVSDGAGPGDLIEAGIDDVSICN